MSTTFKYLFIILWLFLFAYDAWYLHHTINLHQYGLSVLWGALTLFAGYMLVQRVREVWR
jgi:hypothetical protein